MSAARFLPAYLATLPAVTSLVSDRIQPHAAPPSDVRPYITYFVVSENTVESLGGPSGLTTPRIQIDIVADTYTQADTIARAIKGTQTNRKLDGYTGELAGIKCQRALFDSRRDVYDEPNTGKGLGPSRVQLDFVLWLEE